MASISFIIKSKSAEASIYVRFKEGSKFDVTAKTNHSVNYKEWSKAKGKANDKDKAGKDLNEKLLQIRTDLLAHYNKTVNQQSIDIRWLKNFLNPHKEESGIPNLLVPYIDYFTLHKDSVNAPSTKKRNNVYKHLLERFEVARKKSFLIKEVDSTFKFEFERFCAEQKYKHNTVARTIKFIKTVCKHAESNGIEVSPQLKSISVKLKKIDKVFLNLTDLEKIDKVKLKNDYLINARDWLIISCETGQRVSDFMRFKKKMISHRANRSGVLKPVIEFTQVKTESVMAVGLSEKVMAIVNKRGEFPRPISDQRYNEYIKKICKLAVINEKIKGSLVQKLEDKKIRKVDGIYEKWQLIGSHVGRKSFASNNFGRIPTALLRKATGHSSEKSFLIYVGKTETESAVELTDYF